MVTQNASLECGGLAPLSVGAFQREKRCQAPHSKGNNVATVLRISVSMIFRRCEKLSERALDVEPVAQITTTVSLSVYVGLG